MDAIQTLALLDSKAANSKVSISRNQSRKSSIKVPTYLRESSAVKSCNFDQDNRLVRLSRNESCDVLDMIIITNGRLPQVEGSTFIIR